MANPIDLKKFLGFMNSDDSENVIPAPHHALAYNVRFRGTADNLRVESVPGTTLIANPYLQAGTNECIGAHFDPVRQLIYFFIYNSNANHGIYIYNTQSQVMLPLLVNGSATNGDILGFTLQRNIVSVVIIYDSVNGDIILFVDSLKRPTGFNVSRYLNTPYPITYRSFIDVAKAPPQMPPKCCYEYDNVVSFNNLQNALFQFSERFVYDDNQKSVYSSPSEVPLPYDSQYYQTIQETFINARISIYVQTGHSDVKTIEIWGRQTVDTSVPANNNTAATADYFLIASLVKAELGIPDNSIYRYLFYNNNINTEGSIEEEVQLFDFVPQQANCQELLNGNTLIYSGITEGYPNIIPNVSVLPIVNTTSLFNRFNGTLFFASCNGVDSGGIGTQLTLYLTGAGSNDGSNNPLGVTYPATFYVTVKTPTGTDLSFSHAFTEFDTIATILLALRTAAIVQGFSYVGVGPVVNSIILSYPSNVVLYASGNTTTVFQPSLNTLDCYFCFITKCGYDFAMQYYDAKGRTPGAQPFTGNPIQIPENIDGTILPTIQFQIKHRPPLWARSWQLLRSNNLSYSKRVEWVTDQTFTNLDPNNQELYAYIGISNMPEYDADIEAATPVVNYSFAQGDRIRFEIQYPVDAAQSVLTSGYDYAILAVEDNPTINGVVQIGNFIKIQYPNGSTASTGGSGNFDFGGDAFQNYKVLIYGVQQNVLQSNTVYFEFGKCFGIGNAGTATAFHMASDFSQLPDLSTPAQITVMDGDYFYRQRTVSAGLIYYLDLVSNTFGTTPVTLQIGPSAGAVTNGSYKIQSQPTSTFPSGVLPLFTNLLPSTPQRLRLTWTMTLQCSSGDIDTIGIYGSNGIAPPQYLLKNFYLGQGENLQIYTVNIDGYISVPAGAGNVAYLVMSLIGSGARNGSATVKFQVLNNIPVPIIESSFSDKYQIVTNSNSRESLYDPNAAQNYYPNLLRWGLAYQQGTTLNNINRFYFENQDYLDLGRGDIQRMKTRDRIIRFFQNRGDCEKGVYNTFVKDSANQDILTTTNVIITPNNVKYYEGEFGTGSNYAGLVSGKIQDYILDVVKGYIVRLSNDGNIPVSELYKGQFLIRSIIAAYNGNTYSRADGAPSLAFGYYDYLEEEAHFLFQAGTNLNGTIPAYHLVFNEKRNSFTCFMDSHPEWMISAEEDTYSWNGGQMYIHNNTTNYTNYYGVQYYPSITLVFNDKAAIKKTPLTLGYQANQYWVAAAVGDITTSQPDPQSGLPQISQLIQEDFEIQEGMYFASFLCDANSGTNPVLALLNGAYLKGNWTKVKLTYQGSQFAFLYTPYIRYSTSPKILTT